MVVAVSINYWAVLVATIASMVIGSLWYGPVFGKAWMKLMKFSPKDIKKMRLSPAQAMSMGFVATLVMSFVLAHFVDYVGATTIGTAAQLAFWLWLGFSAPLLLGSFLWENKPFKLWVLNAAHRLVEMIVMAAILAVWV